MIGTQLRLENMLNGVDLAVAELSNHGGPNAAEAIMTTDKVSKLAFRVSQSGYTIRGMAKGAGMLAPGLATMLVVITTDAVVSSEDLDATLRGATRTTFDRLDSDGCMSTNDTVVLLASGASEVTPEVGSSPICLKSCAMNLL
jgi:glutamate N-acetyltransferase/amino-acid N-acetyltransferase